VRRLVLSTAAITAVVLALAAGASAAGWHYTFQDFFHANGGSFNSGVAKAKKCSGGRVGTYDFRDFAQAGGGDFDLSLEITSKMSARDKWGRMKDVEVSAESSPTIPPDVAQGLAEGFSDFFNTVFTRYDVKHDELDVRHGSLVLFGSEALEPGESTTKFKPKPGC
jgi:hypothetical protein